MRGAVENHPPRIGRENLRFHVNVRRRNRLIRKLDDLQVVPPRTTGTSSGLIFKLSNTSVCGRDSNLALGGNSQDQDLPDLWIDRIWLLVVQPFVFQEFCREVDQ